MDAQRTIEQAVLDALADGPESIVHVLRDAEHAGGPAGAALDAVRAVLDAKYVWSAWFDGMGVGPRIVSSAEFEAALNRCDLTRPDDHMYDVIGLGLTCVGRAQWRAGAMPWQREVAVDGRIDRTSATTVSAYAECRALAEQILGEWLDQNDMVLVEIAMESPAAFALHPGFGVEGIRVDCVIRPRESTL